MKHLIKYFIMILLAGLWSAVIPPGKVSAQGGEVSFQVFYDQLSPYGQWVDFPDEGYVWVPNAGAGFAPYQTNGYWAYTDYGWTWVSGYPWGWAPFHYGRWDFDEDYGWYWAPEYEWAPAWVAWSSSPGYYGWAPLRPGIEVDAAITSGYYVPPEHWTYAHEEFMGSRDINRHYAPQSENATHIRNSTMINRTNIDSRHTTYMGGPPREEVQKSTGAPVQQLAIVQRATPGQSVNTKQLSMYKPVVAQTTASNAKPAPRAVTSIRDVKPIPGRTPSPERLNAAPPSATTQQTQQKENPPASLPPPIRQSEQSNTQTAQQNNRTAAPEQRQQPAPQQTAPRAIQSQQPAPRAAQQQALPLRQQRTMRYVPPAYNSPKPYNPPQQQHAAPPQQRAAPPQQHAEPPHGPPQQEGKPHQ